MRYVIFLPSFVIREEELSVSLATGMVPAADAMVFGEVAAAGYSE